jgi:hypothetical protein
MLLQLFGTMLGIKVLNVVTNKVVRVLGSRESNERFLSASLYQVGLNICCMFWLLNSHWFLYAGCSTRRYSVPAQQSRRRGSNFKDCRSTPFSSSTRSYSLLHKVYALLTPF